MKFVATLTFVIGLLVLASANQLEGDEQYLPLTDIEAEGDELTDIEAAESRNLFIGTGFWDYRNRMAREKARKQKALAAKNARPQTKPNTDIDSGLPTVESASGGIDLDRLGRNLEEAESRNLFIGTGFWDYRNRMAREKARKQKALAAKKARPQTKPNTDIDSGLPTVESASGGFDLDRLGRNLEEAELRSLWGFFDKIKAWGSNIAKKIKTESEKVVSHVKRW